MHYEKSTHSAASNVLRHVHRLIQNDKNKDIDLERTKTSNQCLTPYIAVVNGEIVDITKTTIKDGDIVTSLPRDKYFTNRKLIQKLEYQHYLDRKNELYCYSRKDLKTLVNIVITLPREITTQSDRDAFFSACGTFLSNRYGSNNLISMVTNADEMKIGREHLHCSLIPACPIDKEKLMAKKNHVKAMEQYSERICANSVITKRDMRTVHRDFQKYLDDVGLKCKVVNKAEGEGKRLILSVEQLKEISRKTGIVLNKPITLVEFAEMVTRNRDIEIVDSKVKERLKELEKENLSLREKISSLEKHIEHQQNHSWQRTHERSGSWGHERNNGWGSSTEKEFEQTW